MKKNIATTLALGPVFQQMYLSPLDFNPFSTTVFKADANYFVSCDNKFIAAVIQYDQPLAIEFLLNVTKIGYKVFGGIESYELVNCEDDVATGLLERPWARDLHNAFNNPAFREFSAMNVPSEVIPDARLQSVTYFTDDGFVVGMMEIDTLDEDTPVSRETLLSILDGEAFKADFHRVLGENPDILKEYPGLVVPKTEEIIPGLV